jgi:hypothetical protein
MPPAALIFRSVALLLSIFGVWTSFHYSFDSFPADGDGAHAPVLWMGMHRYGAHFLTTWRYTQDNWLLTVVPINFLGMMLFGPLPVMVLGIGWLIFLLCCAMTWLITRRFVSPAASWVLLPLFLLSGNFAIGHGGYLGHAFSHGSSLLFGLFSLWAALVWLARRSVPAAFACALAMLLGSLSDPWASAALLAPMGVVAVGLTVVADDGEQRRRLVVLAAVLFGVAVLARTELLGVFGFLPGPRFSLAGRGWIDDNFAWTAQALAGLFNIYPGVSRTWVITTALSCALIAWLYGRAVLALVPARGALSLPTRFLAGVAAISPLATVAAYVIGSIHEPRLEIARLFVNVYFFVPMLIAIACTAVPARFSAPVRIVALVCAALMMVAGPLSKPSAWLRLAPVVQTEEALSLAAYLQAQGLHYGFGPFWGTQANAVSWLSGDAVRIRPVGFDPVDGHVAPRGAETSPLWYQPGDAPPGIGEMFVIVMRDEENCRDVAVCRAGVIAQFGPPARTLTREGQTIFVWSHPIEVR